MLQKLIIVDDDPEVREVLSRLLSTEYEVLEAATGRSALELVLRVRPPLMVLDMSLPDMSGIEVLEAVRASGASLTVIMLTGLEDIEAAQRSLDLGALEYVTKPFDMPALRMRVLRLMESCTTRAEDRSGCPWRASP